MLGPLLAYLGFSLYAIAPAALTSAFVTSVVGVLAYQVLEPNPDILLEDIADQAAGPPARDEARDSIELSFIVALQHLPPHQRAAVVLGDVLGFRTAEVAAMLDSREGCSS